MKWRAIMAATVLLVFVASVALITTRQRRHHSTGPVARVTGFATATGSEPSGPVEPSTEPRWGRATATWDPEHWPPNRADWSDEPAEWQLRSVADVLEIPIAVRNELERLDCAIPSWRRGTGETSVIWGEFERPGQRDLAILCVHTDKTSSTYVFWGAEPARRDVMPESGSSISTKPRADVKSRLDPGGSLDPDMPASVEHDGIEIGCCECCSTIFYRHRGQWFTLPGAD